MDLTSRSMYDTFKDGIWKELGPLDPDWFDVLTSQTFPNEGSVSDVDELSCNQERIFKTPFDTAAADSQLFSTPRDFRHNRVVSPEAEDDQSFTHEQEKETLPRRTTQSPYLCGMSKVGVPGAKYEGIQPQSEDSFDLLQTPIKSPVNYAKQISESLGAQIHPDMSWTSSLNTPPAVPSTLILSKTDGSPCPVSVSADKNVVIVRKLFPSLSNVSRIEASPPKNKNVSALHQGPVSPVADQNPGPHDPLQSSLNQSEGVWKQKLPDAIEDGEIRSTVASVLDGAENVLSIFFSNSSSALRKVKTERTKRKQIILTPQKDCSTTESATTNNAASTEQKVGDQDPGKCSLPTVEKTVVSGNSQWSPLSLSEIPLCSTDTLCRDNTLATHSENKSLTKHVHSDSGHLARPLLTTTPSGLTKKKRKFIYSVETIKTQVQGKEMQTQKMDLSPQTGYEVSVKQSRKVPDEAQYCSSVENEIQKQENMTEEHPKVQDLDMSQLSKDFAEDFTQMPDLSKLSRVAEDPPPNHFSPSACLSAMKQAKQKAKQANHFNFSSNGATVSDSGFQSAIANNSQSQSGFEVDTHRNGPISSTSKEPGNTHLDDSLQKTDASLCSAIKEMLDSGTENGLHKEGVSTQPSWSAEQPVDSINCVLLNGQVNDSLPEKTMVSLPSICSAGFRTASNKGIEISSANLERAKCFFQEDDAERNFDNHSTEIGCDSKDVGSDTTTKLNPQLSSREKCGNVSCQLTASQKADVTELCTLLEEADSQFEFTQFKAAKPPSEHDATSLQTVEKELDPDFLTGIDFDDSFTSNAEKQTVTAVMSDKCTDRSNDEASKITCSSLTVSDAVKENSSTEDAFFSEGSRNMSTEPKTQVKVVDSDINQQDVKTPPKLAVGFKTAGGNVLRVSKQCLRKAKALFADLEEKKSEDQRSLDRQSCETDAKSKPGQITIFTDKGFKNSNLDTGQCGFQMASGKGISVSAEALQEAETFFKDCSVLESNTSMSIKHKKSMKSLPDGVNHKRNYEEFKHVQEIKDNLSEEPVRKCKNTNSGANINVEIDSPRFKNTSALTNADSLHENQALAVKSLFSQSTSKDTRSFVSGFSTASEKKLSLLNEIHALGETKNLEGNALRTDYVNQIQLVPSKNCGFQTASGKGVVISSAALKKAKSLLTDSEDGVYNISVKPGYSTPVTGPPHKNCGFVAASGKPVAISAETLQKAKALFSDIDVKVPVVSDTRNNGNAVVGEFSSRDGFCTASGKKVSVSHDAVRKAKSLLSESMDFKDTNGKRKHCEEALPTPNGGFQTASGKGVAVSSEALKKAKILFSDCSESSGESGVKPICPKLPNAGPQSRNSGFHAASGKPVACSVEALQKAKALFCDISFTPDIPAVSHTGKSDKSQDDAGKIHCGFMTAGGTKVHVSEKNLLKAKTLLKEFDDDLISAKANAGFGCAEPENVHMEPVVNHRSFLQLDDPEINKGVFKNTPVNSASLHETPVLMAKQLSANCLFHGSTTFEDTNTKDTLPTLNSGFQTASGKGVPISSAALKKANTLLSEFEGIGDKIGFQKPFSGPPPKTSGFNSASDQPGALSSQAIQKSTALESMKTDRYDATQSSSHCGFTTAGGAKVSVSQKSLMEAKNLFDDGDCHFSKSSSTSPCDTHESNPAKLKYLERKSYLKLTTVCDNDTSQNKHECEVHQVMLNQGPKSFLTFQSLNLSGCTETQQKLLAQEALDCTKALLEDDGLADQHLSVTLGNVSHQENLKSSKISVEEQKGSVKRSVEDTDMTGQPPLKRRLLEEFDRTVEGPRRSTLLPERSCPSGVMYDRRVFKYSESLYPNVTKPHGHGKNYVEARLQKTTVTQHSTPGDSRSARSKMPAFVPPFYKNAKTPTLKNTGVTDNKRTSAFIPLFKRQRPFAEVPSKSSTYVLLHKTQSTKDVICNESKGDIQTADLAGSTDPKDSLGVEDTISRHQEIQNLENVELARDMQDMRIRKKKRQTIRPVPGSLFLTKTSGVSRIPLKAAVNGRRPARHTQEQLYEYGVQQHVSEITSETAENFRFHLQQFFKQEAFVDGAGVHLADGGWLVSSNDRTAGKEEFYRALCDTPGVDPKLISEEWVYNHYRWIVWKQASMERSFPETTGSLCLTPEQVLLQLKYRYDVEVDHSRRPALRKIMERDDTAAKTLVLCVCGVVSRGQSPNRNSRSDTKTPQGTDAKRSQVENPSAVIWVTDGWYAIKAQVDEPLTAMLHNGRLAVGGKLIIHGAQLVGSQDACSPLEAPESLMLKICTNSSRPARWDTKLGFYKDPRPFLLPVSCLYSNGGPVGCVDIIILRSYPVQWMERKSDGGVVFRSVRAEEKEARRYDNHKQKAMEILFAKIQTEFEREEKDNKFQRRRRTKSHQDIARLQDGEELYEAVGDDPAYLEAHLSEQQLETLRIYRRSLMEKKQAELQDRYRRALEAEDNKGSCPKRDVTPVWRLCVADSMDRPGRVYQLNLWRPSSDLQSLLKEGCRYKVFNLSTSDGKKRSGIEMIQLTGTNKTQFQDLQTSREWLSARFQPRVSANFVDLQNTEFQPLCGEVDVTGCVIRIIDEHGSSPAFYLVDGSLNFVKVRCFNSLSQSGLEDVLKPRVLLALSNLQLRGQSTTPTPVVYAGDLTTFSTNPKERHLQESLTQLRNLVQGQGNFYQTAEEKLSHLVQFYGLSSVTSAALQPHSPASITERQQDTKANPVRSFGSFTPVSRNLPIATSSTEKDPKSLKRRRALDYLCRLPSPPVLSHLSSAASPCLNKTFNPPRRSGTPSTLKNIQTPACKPARSEVEDEWVNDEELAMIDTQALHVGDVNT